MNIDPNLFLMGMGTFIFAAYIFKHISALATISKFELIALHTVFFLPILIASLLLGTNSLMMYFLHMGVALLLFPIFRSSQKFGVLSHQGFLRLVRLGKLRGKVINDLSELSGVDVLVVNRSELNAEDSGPEKLDPRIQAALKSGISIITVPDFLSRNYGFIEINMHIKASQVILRNAHGFDFVKSVFEFVVSLVFLVTFMPVLLVIAILILLVDGAPIIFRQERLGKSGRLFRIWKFRTFNHDNVGTTRLGDFLRRSHLDELPQLLNVVAGDMSLVGPRPEWTQLNTPEFAPADYWIRRTIRPGITGWAQVNYRPSFTKYMRQKKLGYDIYYINNRSVFLDSLIWIRTIAQLLSFVVLSRKR